MNPLLAQDPIACWTMNLRALPSRLVLNHAPFRTTAGHPFGQVRATRTRPIQLDGDRWPGRARGQRSLTSTGSSGDANPSGGSSIAHPSSTGKMLDHPCGTADAHGICPKEDDLSIGRMTSHPAGTLSNSEGKANRMSSLLVIGVLLGLWVTVILIVVGACWAAQCGDEALEKPAAGAIAPSAHVHPGDYPARISPSGGLIRPPRLH